MKKILFVLLIIISVGMSYSWNQFSEDPLNTSLTFNFTEAGQQTINFLYPNGTSYYVTNLTFTLTGNPVANWTQAIPYVGDSHFSAGQLLGSTKGYFLSFSSGGGGGGGSPTTFYSWNGSDLTVISNTTGYAFDILSTDFGFVGGTSTNLPVYFYNGSSLILNQIITTVTTNSISAIDLFNESLGFLTTNVQGIFAAGTNISRFNGVSWTNETMPEGSEPSEMLRGVKILNSSLAFAVGEEGVIYKWNGSDWLNDSFSHSVPNNLYAIDNHGDSLAFAVGHDGQIIKWNGTTWANETSPVYADNHDLFGVVVLDSTKAYAVGDDGSNSIFLEWDGSTWTRTDLTASTVSLYGVAVTEVFQRGTKEVIAFGENFAMFRKWGYPNGASLGWGSPEWNQSETELRNETWDSDEWDGDWSFSGVYPYDDYLDYIELNVSSPASVTVTWKVEYGSIMDESGLIPDGLIFKLLNGSNVNETVITNDSDIYVWDDDVLVVKIPMNFNETPNYSGWFAEAGFNSNNHACVNASSLDDAGNPMNLSLKTLYLLKKNASLGSVCLIDAAVSLDVLKDIVNNSHCTNTQVEGVNGTVHNDYLTEEIGGQIYFVIPDVVNSGVVQIVNLGGTGNPPSFDAVAVNPSSGDSDTSFVFTATVYDLDNDSVGVDVVIGGITYSLTPVDSESTVNGKDFSLTTPLPTGVFSYYFKASDGNYSVTTSTYTGLTVGSGTPVIVSAPGFNFMWVVLLFFSATIIFRKLKI